VLESVERDPGDECENESEQHCALNGPSALSCSRNGEGRKRTSVTLDDTSNPLPSRSSDGDLPRSNGEDILPLGVLTFDGGEVVKEVGAKSAVGGQGKREISKGRRAESERGCTSFGSKRS
jgi:hypothetical protein